MCLLQCLFASGVSSGPRYSYPMPVRHYKVAPIQALCKNSDRGGSAKQYTESKGLRCHRDYILRVSRRFVYKRFSRLGPRRFRFVGFRAYASNVRDPNLVGLSVSLGLRVGDVCYSGCSWVLGLRGFKR